MGQLHEAKVPDIGNHTGVPVIEVLVKVGDVVKQDQGLVTLESDKATMEVPAPLAGIVKDLKVKLGDKLSEGSVVAVIEVADAATGNVMRPAPNQATSPATSKTPDAFTPSPAPAGEGWGGGKSPGRASAPSSVAPPSSGRTPDIECRLVVLGAGPGGYTAAFRAADLGLDTVLIERYPTLGGVCLNVGCIPSKALLHAAAVIDEAAHATAYGIDFGAPKIALDTLRAYKDKVVGQLTKGLAGMAKQRKVRVVNGTAKFVSPHELEIATPEGNTLLRFEQCIIAAGSQALKLPGFPWEDARVMDSTDALALADIPKKMLVVGGGIIGLEMATVYRALGSEVTV
ncbi:MAG: FAD-dependent oxidoreductase, partial [Proteobacteria bacterium]|nr:FAD-dependent oxidoreductase [Pseudomonadota bacterium]